MSQVRTGKFALAAILLTSLAPSSWVRATVRLTVAQDGSAPFNTVQAAINSVPTGNTERYVIDIAPGTYFEQVRVNKPFVTLHGTGANPSSTVLTYNQVQVSGNPLNNASTAIQSADFVAQNLTFENTAGQNAGQALAMRVGADRAVFDHCRFLGWQDTLRSETGRHYFQDCYVEGSVDFIYGKGQAWFEDCTTFSKASGYVTAQGREGSAETNGYVFHNATVTGSASNDSVYLGRPWQAYSRSIFLESNLGDLVNPAGWSQWSGNNNHLTSYFAEYGNTGLGAAGTRPSWTYKLDAATAATYSINGWLGGSDSWNPLAALPEPGSLAILTMCLIGLASRRRS